MMLFGLWAQNGPRNRDSGGVQIPAREGKFWGKGLLIVKYQEFLPCSVQKWLNQSIYRLGCGLGWAEGSTSSVIFARWHQCAHMGRHIGATRRIRLNHPSATVLQSYVKLLWPLVLYLSHQLQLGCHCWVIYYSSIYNIVIIIQFVMRQVPVSQILRCGGHYTTWQFELIVKCNVKQMCL